MLRKLTLSLAAGATLAIGASFGETAAQARGSAGAPSSAELPAYLQCVPYAREVSGVQIYGDAHTWWKQAAGKYKRGNTPKVGAVMAFRPHRNMRLGHVAAVSRIIDSRTVLLRHSNWSPINGRRGQIEDDVKAIDVSPNNDWSSVRVWYHPIQKLGKTAWPIHGFIYNKEGSGQLAPTRLARAAAPKVAPVRLKSSRQFVSAFSNLSKPAAAPKRAPLAKQQRGWTQPVPVAQRQSAQRRSAQRPASQRDPVAVALSKYD